MSKILRRPFSIRSSARDSGMHVHQSLWKDGETLMHAADGYALLSPLAVNYAAGLLAHAPALLAFCAPSTNSYRRLVPGYEAPVLLKHSQRNRSAAVRIPMYSTSAKAKRVEFRPPDPLADIPTVPTSLDEALDALEADHGFLNKGGVFTDDLIATYVGFRREQSDRAARANARRRSLDIWTTKRRSALSRLARDPGPVPQEVPRHPWPSAHARPTSTPPSGARTAALSDRAT